MDLSSAVTGGGTVAATVLLMGQIPNNFSGPLPSFFTISSDFFQAADSVDGNRRRIRMGEAFGAVLTAVEGVAVSALTGSAWPLAASLLMAGLLIAGYEWALRHPAKNVERGRSLSAGMARGWWGETA